MINGWCIQWLIILFYSLITHIILGIRWERSLRKILLRCWSWIYWFFDHSLNWLDTRKVHFVKKWDCAICLMLHKLEYLKFRRLSTGFYFLMFTYARKWFSYGSLASMFYGIFLQKHGCIYRLLEKRECPLWTKKSNRPYLIQVFCVCLAVRIYPSANVYGL